MWMIKFVANMIGSMCSIGVAIEMTRGLQDQAMSPIQGFMSVFTVLVILAAGIVLAWRLAWEIG